MTVHIKKLCVGVEHLDQLRNWQSTQGEVGLDGVKVVRHVTRATPKRGDEVLADGSIYWVIKGWIMARNEIVALVPVEDAEGRKKCAILLKCGPIEVVPRKHRPFQGWRYLNASDAPKDLGEFKASKSDTMPPEMVAELNDLGLL